MDKRPLAKVVNLIEAAALEAARCEREMERMRADGSDKRNGAAYQKLLTRQQELNGLIWRKLHNPLVVLALCEVIRSSDVYQSEVNSCGTSLKPSPGTAERPVGSR